MSMTLVIFMVIILKRVNTGFIITKPDGTQTVYKILCLVALKMELFTL